MTEETKTPATEAVPTHKHADGTVHEGAACQHEEVVDTLPPNVVAIEEAGAARKRIKITVSAERIADKFKTAFDELKKDAVLPGFRRGRAPKRLLEKRFGEDLKQTVKGQVVAEAYEKAVETHKLATIGEPEIDMKKVELPASGPMEFSLEVEVTPEFELPNIEKIAVKRPKLEANDERLNLAVENLRRHFGKWVPAAGPAGENDTVLADVKVQDSENQIITEQPAVQLAVKAGSIAGVQFENLGEKLTGAVPSATITLDAVVPETHLSEKLRGKKITVTLNVKEVQHLDLPEANEDFAKMLGFGNLEELKSDLRERLVVQLEQETKGAMAQQVYRYLLEHTNLSLPPSLSQRQMVNVLRRRATELMQRGVPENDIAQHIDQLRISSAQQSAVDLKLFFILGKLAEQFSVDVSESELNGRIASIAAQYGRRPERVKHQLQQQGQIEQLFLQVRDGKVVDKLLETAEITDVDEKTLAEEFKNLPPLSNVGPHIEGVSTTSAEKK